MRKEKAKLTLWVDKDLVVSAKVFKLNLSQLVIKSLQNFFIKQEINPEQLVSDIFNEKQDKRDERREFYRKRAEEFWLKVYARREARKRERREFIQEKIEERKLSPYIMFEDEGDWLMTEEEFEKMEETAEEDREEW